MLLKKIMFSVALLSTTVVCAEKLSTNRFEVSAAQQDRPFNLNGPYIAVKLSVL
jgi:hypothetical protein